MYNRYIRNDQGGYERISVPEPEQSHTQYPRETDHHRQEDFSYTREEHQPPPRQNHHQQHSYRPPPTCGRTDQKGLFSGILNKLKLDEIDTGDLLLLVILFLLFKEGDDEELLIALGLLLIL